MYIPYPPSPMEKEAKEGAKNVKNQPPRKRNEPPHAFFPDLNMRANSGSFKT